MTKVIEVENICKLYGPKTTPVVAVGGVSFSVPKGQIVALLGGNGAGKSTTIAMLLGLIKPSAGSIKIFGIDMATKRHQVLPRMNFCSPYVDLPQRLTIYQNLLIYARLYGVRDAKQRIHSLAEQLDLTHLLQRPSGQLSAGQKTRLGLAKALINQPELLLLDEPTASLDPDTADRMRSWLEEYQRQSNATILMASHNMAEVERMAQNVLMMKGGQLVDQGSPAALVEKYGRSDMEQVFLTIARSETGQAA